MRKLVVLLIIPVLLFGCAIFDKMYSKPEHLICDQIEAKDSIICREAHRIGVEPEQMGDLLLDATAIAVIVDPENKQRIGEFIKAVEDILTKTPILTFANLVGFLEDEKEKSELIAQIVSRRLDWLKVDEIIGQFDYKVIMIHLEHQKAQLNLNTLKESRALPQV